MSGKPWSKRKAARAQLAPDDTWSDDIVRRILADCHPWQRQAVVDPASRISLLIGRGGTKTSSMRARALIKLVTIERADILYLALTRPAAEKLNWYKLKDAIAAYGISDDFEFSDYRLRAICKRTGATYWLAGMQDDADVEQFRGWPLNELQIDECGSHDPDRLDRTLKQIIGPRLGERNGCAILGGTPAVRPRGIFYHITRPGACFEDGTPIHRRYEDRDLPEFANWQGWSSHSWSLRDIVKLPNAEQKYPALVANWREALIDKERNRYGDDHPVWLREWCGIWAADDTTTVFVYQPHKDGQPWNVWTPYGDRKLEGVEQLRAAIAALPKAFADWRFILSQDMGNTHPFACNIFAFAPNDPERMMWHVFCHERTGMYARAIAELLLGEDFVMRLLRGEKVDFMHSGGLFGVIGWPDGMVMDADPTTLDELSKVYGLRFHKADRTPNYKHGAIELVNGDLRDGRIKILGGTLLEVQLQSLQWEEDRFGAVRPNRKQADHSADCLIGGRKLIAALFDSGAVANENAPKKPANDNRDPQDLDGEGEAPGEYDRMLSSTEYGGRL